MRTRCSSDSCSANPGPSNSGTREETWSGAAAAASFARTMHSVPRLPAAAILALRIAPPGGAQGVTSRRIGIGTSRSGSVLGSSSLGPNTRCVGLDPMSTDVLMYSRPWMPSRVGRTISDMSVQMESNPGPANGPRYPAPETGMRPVSACSQVVAIMSGRQ